MIRFILFYFGVYGGCNAYLFWKIYQAWRPGRTGALLLALFLLFMVAGPFVVHWLEARGPLWSARLLAAFAYSWMAITLWALFLFVIIDLYNLAVWTAHFHFPSAGAVALAPRRAFWAVAGICLVLCIWGVLAALPLRVERLTLRTPHLPADARPITIFQISDIHLHLLVGAHRVGQIVRAFEQLRPDLLVMTGDMFDGEAENHLEQWAPVFSALRPPLGKFAVTGNHEYYFGIRRSVEYLEKFGFRMLRGEAVRISPNLLLAGVDDPAGHRRESADDPRESAILPPPRRATSRDGFAQAPALDQPRLRGPL